MLARLQKAIEDRPVVVGLGVLSIGAVGYIAYKLAFPPRAFKDVEFDDCPDNLRDLAQAIHDAGAEDLFFQVEASTLRTNFMRFAETSKDTGEMVLTQDGFTALMHSLGVQDTRMLQRIFESWDKDGDGEFDFKEFLQAVALVLKGSSDQKVATLFHIIDSNGDGSISKPELVKFYTNMYELRGAHKSQDAIAKQVDALFHGVDKDFSGRLSFAEFEEACATSKFVVGETFTEFLDELTRKFTEGLSGTAASRAASKEAPVRAKTSPVRSKSMWK